MPDEILWRAQYTDSSTLYQRGPNGDKHGYQDIQRDKLVAFDLWQGDRLLCRIDMRPDRLGDSPRHLIWRIRHIMNDRGRDDRIHLVGWQRTVNGENVQAILYVFEDGTVLLGGEWGADVEFMHAVTPLECEKAASTTPRLKAGACD